MIGQKAAYRHTLVAKRQGTGVTPTNGDAATLARFLPANTRASAA